MFLCLVYMDLAIAEYYAILWISHNYLTFNDKLDSEFLLLQYLQKCLCTCTFMYLSH